MDKPRNRPKGYGYVTFSKKDDVIKACKGMNGKGFEFTSVPSSKNSLVASFRRGYPKGGTLQNDEVAEADPFDALQPLLGKLMSEWESRLSLINDVLDEADQKPDTNQAMKNWLSKLRDLAYDVEDILDECQTEALKRKLKGAKSQASTSTVQPSAVLPNGPKLQGIPARWEDIMKERSDLGLDINVTRRSNKANPRVQTTSLVKEHKSVSGEICSHLDATKSSGATSYAKVRHLSLISHQCGTSQRFEPFYEMESLRTLLAIRSSSFGLWTHLSNKTLYIGVLLEWEHWDSSDGRNEEPAGGKFPKLVELTLQNCPKLIGKLPGCLPSLKKLHISGCPQLTNLPEMVPSLRELKVECCDEVIFRVVPNFTSLTTLEIREISGLVGLHEAFVEALVALEDLKIKHCRELKYLWQDGVDVDKLANLQSLCILWCKQLVSLVEGAEGILPYSLKRLEMRWCDSMESLPDGMMTVMNSNNSNQCLLEELVIQDCPSLKSLPRGKLPATIKKLDVEGCKELESEYRFLEGIMRCDAHLEYLRVSKFSIQSFPTGKFPTSLETIEFDGCRRIQSLPSLLNLSHLSRLTVEYCNELESFSDQELPSLTSLFICDCKKLRSLPNHMDSLRQLWIFSCPDLVSFPETSLPPKLTSLVVMGCKNPRQPISEWRLHTLTSLQQLRISNTTDEDCFPDDDGLLLPISLTSLQIDNQKKLKSISSGIQHLTSLEQLRFWDCPELQVLPKEGFPAALGLLQIINCPLLGERCLEEEGDYWPIIAHIPRVQVQSNHTHPQSHVNQSFDYDLAKMPTLFSLWQNLLCPGGFPATLGYLLINSSPLLKERCLKEEGDYWPLVAHIPCVDIDEAESDEEISEEETSNAEISDDDTSNEEATNGDWIECGILFHPKQLFTDEAFFLKTLGLLIDLGCNPLNKHIFQHPVLYKLKVKGSWTVTNRCLEPSIFLLRKMHESCGRWRSDVAEVQTFVTKVITFIPGDFQKLLNVSRLGEEVLRSSKSCEQVGLTYQFNDLFLNALVPELMVVGSKRILEEDT
ncbi:unnamed protein product [Dovyalis caffra]|uniref:Uncharacterized protein n=1 Tax=Dovyalis caffra TaxID=77055 RepID=A0AAV1R5X6_9ROSI|nr:unnamed protein product [Dovyalis caffra]